MQSRQAHDAYGVDVSNWQGAIDWHQVAASGISFAYMKATEGGTYRDPQYDKYARAAQQAGVQCGAYHFARPGDNHSANAQADFFVGAATVNGSLGALPPALDLEDAGGLSKSALSDWVRAFVNRIKGQTGRSCVLYVSPGFAGSHLDDSLSDIDLWVADWSMNAPQSFNGWTSWRFWQYTDSGRVSGISGPVDRDVFSGSSAAIGGHSSAGQPSTRPPQTHPKSRPDSHSHTSEPTVSSGSRGMVVIELQLSLYHAGQNPGPVDGDFGPRTLAAVKSFQQSEHISVDGIVGPVTWSHLNQHVLARRPEISRGSTGTEVVAAQDLLQYRGANPGVADGIFGSRTEAAVKRFQHAVNIAVDGIVGPVTWSHLV